MTNYAPPSIAALQAAVAALQQAIAAAEPVTATDAATLAALRGQTRAALTLAIQMVNYYDAALSQAGDPANFVGGTAPAKMAANITELLAANEGLVGALSTANALSRIAVNLREIAAPSGALADLDHTFGNDLGVSASGDIGTVTGWRRTVQRVIRRLCTAATRPAPATANLAVSPGDDLFRIAATQYGDATGWALIAAANGLADPLIQADAVLTIPAWNAARANDGILNLV